MKSIPLQGVLVADAEGFRTQSGSLNEDARLFIGRRVDRDFDFNVAFGAEELHALERDHLRAAGERGLATREIEQRGNQAVGAKIGIAFDEGGDAGGSAPKIQREVWMG